VADPNPFLSTIAATSATLVAIIGGLLVARFVSLTSEQDGAKRVLEDARERFRTAELRAAEAKADLRDWEISRFFDDDVLEAISHGEYDVGELRRLAGDTPLSDENIADTVEIIAEEFGRARSTLRELRVMDTDAPGGGLSPAFRFHDMFRQ